MFQFRSGFAQEKIDKEVHVIKPYEPTISDAYKINVLPKSDDTLTIVPSFNYSIVPSRINTHFDIKPINAAKVVGEPLTKLYNSYLKIGAGNYISTLLELNMNNLRSNKHSVGTYLKHMSSNGKIKLDNDEKTAAGYNENKVQLYGTKFYRKAILSGDVSYNANGFSYYGVDTILNKDDIKQNFICLNTYTFFKSTHTDSSHLNYNISLNYDLFRDKNENIENGLIFSTKFDKFLKKESEVIGINAKLSYFDKSVSIDSSYNIVIHINPWVCKFSDEWKVFIGLNYYSDLITGENENYFYPKARLEFNVIENILIPYFGIDGKFEVNNYKKIANRNFFITPGLHVKNTDYKKIIYGGLKGSFSSKTAFNFKAKYSVVDDMFFFVNDTSDILENQFNVVYDDVEIFDFYGEVSMNQLEKLSFLLKGNYYQYTMRKEEKPWHEPEYDLTLTTKYNLRNKIIVSADIFAISDRFTRSFVTETSHIKLNRIVDLNLSIEYRYTKILSAFMCLNNNTSAKYYRWNQYPMQGFNLMAGFTYAL